MNKYLFNVMKIFDYKLNNNKFHKQKKYRSKRKNKNQRKKAKILIDIFLRQVCAFKYVKFNILKLIFSFYMLCHHAGRYQKNHELQGFVSMRF